jgi:Ca-activated chloride channel family protein
MQDGTYQVRLVMRDNAGHAYREAKSFVIASKPPALRVTLDRSRARPGESVRVRADASRSTRTIVARLYGTEPVNLRWEATARASTGVFIVPDALPAGRYMIRVTAEDMAHNTASQEVALDVVP